MCTKIDKKESFTHLVIPVLQQTLSDVLKEEPTIVKGQPYWKMEIQEETWISLNDLLESVVRYGSSSLAEIVDELEVKYEKEQIPRIYEKLLEVVTDQERDLFILLKDMVVEWLGDHVSFHYQDIAFGSARKDSKRWSLSD